MPSEIAVSAHASRKISQICMGANTRLLRCEILIVAGLAHSFAIVYFRLMRTAVYLLSSPGSSKLSSFSDFSLLGLNKLICIISCHLGINSRISRDNLELVVVDRLDHGLNHIGRLVLSYII